MNIEIETKTRTNLIKKVIPCVSDQARRQGGGHCASSRNFSGVLAKGTSNENEGKMKIYKISIVFISSYAVVKLSFIAFICLTKL